MTLEKDMGFSVIQNNGKESGYSQKCLFISILDWFRINSDKSCPLKELSLRELFNMAGPLPGYNDMMWDSDCDGHMRYLLKICKLLDIHIHMYYANSEKRGHIMHFWLGNPQPFVDPSCVDESTDPDRTIPIVAWGMHFELLVSPTATARALTIPKTFKHRIKHYTDRTTPSTVISGSRKRKSNVTAKKNNCNKKTGNIKCKRHKKNEVGNIHPPLDSSMVNILQIIADKPNILETHFAEKHFAEKHFAKNVENISYYINLIESRISDHKLYNNYKTIIELLIEVTAIETDDTSIEPTIPNI